MGDFPLWVDREDVDSQAVFSAYMRYQLVTQGAHFRDATDWRPVWWGHLHMILHRVGDVEGTLIRPDMEGGQRPRLREKSLQISHRLDA